MQRQQRPSTVSCPGTGLLRVLNALWFVRGSSDGSPPGVIQYVIQERDMATRTVRLDDEAETALAEVRKATGLPISEALKRGLRTLRDQVRQECVRTPYDVFRELDLGPGGYAIGPSTDTRRTVRRAVKSKLRR
jgi:hypothetical protein